MLEKILKNKNRIKISILVMTLVALGYSLVSFFLYKAGAHPQQVTLFNIIDEKFFFWGTFFYAPVIIAGWVLASVSIQFLAKFFGGKGEFKDTLALIGIVTAIATLGTLLPDLIITPAQAFGFWSYTKWDYSVNNFGIWFYITWTYLLIYFILFLILYPAVIKTVHKLKKWQAIAVGILGFAVYQGFLFIFIR